MTVDAPLFLHLLGYALWLGGAAGATFLAFDLKRRREWRDREVVSHLLQKIGHYLLLPAMILTLGAGVWLFFASRQGWPPPRWLYVKILVSVGPLCAGVGGLVYRAKIQRVVESGVAAPSAALEDQFEGLSRGYLLTGVLFLLTMGFVVALAAIRPNW
jgi:uncharacterized membrane protein